MILPASAEGKPFVRVFAWGGGNYYYAIDPEGGVVGRPNPHNDHVIPENLKPVTQVGLGRHISIMLQDDGTLNPTPNGHHAPHVPKDGDYIKVAGAYNVNAALKKSGEVTVFGYQFRKDVRIRA